MTPIVGKIYRVKDGTKCEQFNNLGGEYIKVISTAGFLHYGILDDNREWVGFCVNCFKPEDLLPVKNDLDSLQVGDILDCGDGYTKKVLAVIGSVLVLSKANNYDGADGVFTVQEIKKYGWKLQNAEPEEDEEVTEAIGPLEGKGYKVEKK